MCHENGDVEIRLRAPVTLDILVTRRDVERMAQAGSPEMRAAMSNMMRKPGE
jgi:hypothetical protein